MDLFHNWHFSLYVDKFSTIKKAPDCVFTLIKDIVYTHTVYHKTDFLLEKCWLKSLLVLFCAV